MDPPPAPSANPNEASSSRPCTGPLRTQSFSQKSDDSQTAAEFLDSQLQLEADAREALPYKFEKCTKEVGKLRQALYSCLTCNPPPANLSDPYNAAGVCYSCSIQCHGEHTLVELFNKRDFVCDCGTKRFPSSSPCTIRLNPETNTKGGIHSEEPASTNKYNQNFKNRFCGCECDYDAYKEKGTMFQCLGLGTAETGGCGEDWWHPGCIVGLGPNWYDSTTKNGTMKSKKSEGLLESITEVAEAVVEDSNGTTTTDAASSGSNPQGETIPDEESEDEELPLPSGFPEEDDFEGFICYKCVDAHPWIKRYAGAPGFLAPVFRRSAAPSPEVGVAGKTGELIAFHLPNAKKRKADEDDDSETSVPAKRVKDEVEATNGNASSETAITAEKNDTETQPKVDEKVCKVKALPPAPTGQLSLFFKSDFRDHLCHCDSCFPSLKIHEQLVEEEEIYEPSVSEEEEAGGSTVGSGSIYDRGESALKNVDRVRAIEGVMAYNHLKDKLKPFFQQFAESGKAISAEDIKAHFAKMRGDEQAIKEANDGAKESEDHRKEQGGY